MLHLRPMAWVLSSSLLLSLFASPALADNHSLQWLHDGKPKEFSVSLYGEASDTTISATLSGQGEGRDPVNAKLKISANITVERRDHSADIAMQAIVHGGYAYILIESVTGNYHGDLSLRSIAELQGRWHQVPVDPVWYVLLRPFTLDVALPGLQVQKQRLPQHSVYHVALDDPVDQSGDDSRFSGTDWLAAVLRHVSFGLVPDLSHESASKLRMKVDTNDTGDFRYGRFWMGLDHAKAHLNLRLSGNSKRIFHPVYISVPPQFESVATLRSIIPLDWFSLSRPTVEIDVEPTDLRLYGPPPPPPTRPDWWPSQLSSGIYERQWSATDQALAHCLAANTVTSAHPYSQDALDCYHQAEPSPVQSYIPSYIEGFETFSRNHRQAPVVEREFTTGRDRYGVPHGLLRKRSQRLVEREAKRRQARRVVEQGKHWSRVQER